MFAGPLPVRLSSAVGVLASTVDGNAKELLKRY
jgi:hypothetical protein